MATVFGYTQDPPKSTDRPFTPDLLRSSGDEWVDLSRFATPTDQYSLSSCVGNATADSVEIMSAVAGKPVPELSRLFVYTMARSMQDLDRDGQKDTNRDAGTYVRLAFDVLAKFGICREVTWPYDLRRVYTMPSIMSLREATGHRIHSYYRIGETGQDRVEAVKTALRAHHPVVFGTQIPGGFSKVRGHKVGLKPGAQAGGHAMVIVGWVQPGYFLVKNSWGAGWGNGGFWLADPSWIAWENSHDFWVPTLGTSFK
jgi:hypothetical protein